MCGLKGSKRCGQCNTSIYCSKEHQILDWPSHKVTCNLSTTTDNFNICFPELEIVLESEPEKAAKTDIALPSEPHVKSEMEVLVSEMNLDDESENENEPVDSKTHVDSAFIKFQRRVSREPQQIIRYACHGGEKGLPLWVNADTRPTKDEIGSCKKCGEVNVFELQIMPQMIIHTASDLDWGSIFIFTCPSLCSIDNHTEHAVWKQDFSKDGMRNPNEIEKLEK